MKLKFERKKNSRIKKRFLGMTSYSCIWFNESSKLWEDPCDESLKIPGCKSSHRQCNSVRAFRRLLKSAPIGVEFILSSRYVGYDVIGKGTKK